MRSLPLLDLYAVFALVALSACGPSSPAATGAADATPGGDDASVTHAGDDGGNPLGASEDSGAGSPLGDGSIDPDGSAPLPPQSCPPSWTTTPACGGGTATDGGAPDFGPNVLVFDPSMSMASIQSQLAQIYGEMDSAQFGTGRYALLFKPGQYALDVQVGFYTQLLGLGRSPDDVVITGAVRAKADWLGSNNATCNFWRAAENFAVVPTQAIDSNTDVWAVSQGTALRRAHVMGTIALDDNGGWSSGGFIADSKIDTQINSGTQQQFLTRNVDLTQWQGQNWNMVFVGDGQPPAGTWPTPPYTVESTTPRIREKPFLFVDDQGAYFVMVPALETGSQGRSWATAAPPGSAVSVDRFHVARSEVDTSASLNAALAAGQHLLFTPGIYHLDAALQVARPGTILLGLGLATLIPDDGNALIAVADVDAVTVAGLLLEAGPISSPVLLQVGSAGGAADHSKAPTALFDVHCRVGGADVGTADTCVTIESSDVLVDNMWLWRADHGAGAAWTGNPSKHGLVVNGANATFYGLFAEHFQDYQALFNGNGGSVFFYQSEMPYDPPDQAAWQEAPGVNGFASYKVADGVTTHRAEGLGVYSVFTNDVQAANAIETPTGAGISMHHMVTVSLAAGSIANIVNGTGGAVAQGGNMVAKTSD